ncbi:MAG: hypothetical protein GC160_04175 [Acidobacteria bacterium]|nr:hypothetical protein [Acidobacteriota bacterium]
MAKFRYSMLQDDWDVDESGFTSPLKPRSLEQTLLFGDRVKNGSISADITPLEGRKTRNDELSLEASLVFRYSGPDSYFYAGTAAFDSKFFVGKVIQGPIYQHRQAVGRRHSVAVDQTYHLRVEFNGSRITLYDNDVQQLTVFDEFYQIGQVGLRTFRTRARFEKVEIRKQQPRAFVVMPFAQELDFVHRVIAETIQSFGIDCVRADQIYISRPVVEDLKEQIAAADIVIVDFTGKNPNVYYEAGLADAWKKDWIVLAQSADDLTFDVRHIRTIRYANVMGADVKLRDDLTQALQALGHQQVMGEGTGDGGS